MNINQESDDTKKSDLKNIIRKIIVSGDKLWLDSILYAVYYYRVYQANHI